MAGDAVVGVVCPLRSRLPHPTPLTPNGIAQLQVLPGDVEVRVQRYGCASKTLTSPVVPGSTIRLTVELQPKSVQKEEITVTATRTDVRIEDEPLHVEVLNKEEVEEKTLMTPGDIAMMLKEAFQQAFDNLQQIPLRC